MPRIVLQPCANKVAQEHYETTVTVPVPLVTTARFLDSEDSSALDDVAESGSVRLWGAKPGEDGRNERRWNRVHPGDYLLFVHGRERVSAARVHYTFRSEGLARDLWGDTRTANGTLQTWDFMFALAKPQEFVFPNAALNALIGRKPNAAVQEFVVLGDDASDAVVAHLGLDGSEASEVTVGSEGTAPPPDVSSSTPGNVLYGEVPGCPVGTIFKNRQEAYEAGVHRTTQAGIAGQSEGTQSICLSAGYSDDEIQGDLITYTGFGGRDAVTNRHVQDQQLERGNLGLVENYKLGRPVRVLVRQSVLTQRSRDADYIYLGLYQVTSWGWATRDDHKVLIYQLRAQPGASVLAEEATSALDRGEDLTAQRRSSHVSRIVRNYNVSASIKKLYNNTCQVCSTRLLTGAGPYSEGAHIRPLGIPHNGPDTLANMLCLCPNCHTLFDGHAITIDDDLTIYNLGQRQGTLTVDVRHKMDVDNLRYQRELSRGMSSAAGDDEA